jgi:glycosyltransferase involved in cell wall biosynthesis
MRPIRVLHVVGSMNRGGIETWLMHVARQIDRKRFSIDFLVSNRSQSPLEKQIDDLGCKIHVCMAHSQPLRYAYNLRRILRSESYDIVHSNLHHLNGLVAMVAAASGVPVRIAHSHFDISGKKAEDAGFNNMRYRFARRLTRRFATGQVGCSAVAGRALFGNGWLNQPHSRIILCGIDLQPFRAQSDRNTLLAALDIPADAVVIGHAGRFVAQKNHAFFMDIAEEYARTDRRAHFLLVGDGPLLAETKARAAASTMANRFHFTGARDDVPNLMVNAMNCFLLPSHFEGGPIALVEAQAAGLPCVFSDVIAPETEIYRKLLWKISLNSPVKQWTQALQHALRECSCEMKAAAFQAVESSAYNITSSLEDLQNYYMELFRLSRNPAGYRQTASSH